MAQLEKGKKILVWENKQPLKYIEVLINSKTFRTIELLFNHVTHKLGTTKAVRLLIDMETKEAVEELDGLRDKGRYVAVESKNGLYSQENYLTIPEYEKTIYKRTLPIYQQGDIGYQNHNFLSVTRKQFKTIIFVFLNGKPRVPGKKFVFTREDLEGHWEIILKYMGRLLNVFDGLQGLYTITGIKICGPKELQHGSAYVAVPFQDGFRDIDYLGVYRQFFRQMSSYTLDIKAVASPNNFLRKENSFLCVKYRGTGRFQRNMTSIYQLGRPAEAVNKASIMHPPKMPRMSQMSRKSLIARPSQVRPSQVRPSQVRPSQVRPSQVRPSQVRPSQIRPSQVRPSRDKMKPEPSETIQLERKKSQKTPEQKTQPRSLSCDCTNSKCLHNDGVGKVRSRSLPKGSNLTTTCTSCASVCMKDVGVSATLSTEIEHGCDSTDSLHEKTLTMTCEPDGSENQKSDASKSDKLKEKLVEVVASTSMDEFPMFKPDKSCLNEKCPTRNTECKETCPPADELSTCIASTTGSCLPEDFGNIQETLQKICDSQCPLLNKNCPRDCPLSLSKRKFMGNLISDRPKSRGEKNVPPFKGCCINTCPGSKPQKSRIPVTVRRTSNNSKNGRGSNGDSGNSNRRDSNRSSREKSDVKKPMSTNRAPDRFSKAKERPSSRKPKHVCKEECQKRCWDETNINNFCSAQCPIGIRRSTMMSVVAGGKRSSKESEDHCSDDCFKRCLEQPDITKLCGRRCPIALMRQTGNESDDEYEEDIQTNTQKTNNFTTQKNATTEMDPPFETIEELDESVEISEILEYNHKRSNSLITHPRSQFPPGEEEDCECNPQECNNDCQNIQCLKKSPKCTSFNQTPQPSIPPEESINVLKQSVGVETAVVENRSKTTKKDLDQQTDPEITIQENLSETNIKLEADSMSIYPVYASVYQVKPELDPKQFELLCAVCGSKALCSIIKKSTETEDKCCPKLDVRMTLCKDCCETVSMIDKICNNALDLDNTTNDVMEYEANSADLTDMDMPEIESYEDFGSPDCFILNEENVPKIDDQKTEIEDIELPKDETETKTLNLKLEDFGCFLCDSVILVPKSESGDHVENELTQKRNPKIINDSMCQCLHEKSKLSSQINNLRRSFYGKTGAAFGENAGKVSMLIGKISEVEETCRTKTCMTNCGHTTCQESHTFI